MKSFVLVSKMRFSGTEDVIGVRLPDSKQLYLRGGGIDIGIFRQIFVNDEYGYDIRSNPDFIIDAGAHCGMASIYFANRFPGLKIVSIEPHEKNFHILKQNSAMYKDIHPVKAAVWHISTSLKLKNPKGDFPSFQFSESSEAQLGSTDSVTIDGIVREFNLSGKGLLKMDIEGAEKNIFDYTKSAAFIAENFDIIFVEPHERYADGAERSIEEFAQKNNYQVKHRGENIILEK